MYATLPNSIRFEKYSMFIALSVCLLVRLCLCVCVQAWLCVTKCAQIWRMDFIFNWIHSRQMFQLAVVYQAAAKGLTGQMVATNTHTHTRSVQRSNLIDVGCSPLSVVSFQSYMTGPNRDGFCVINIIYGIKWTNANNKMWNDCWWS